MYADYEYYTTEYKGTLPEEEAVKALKQASRHIDTLTYNRIVGAEFERLTAFQQGIIKETACMMADFEHNNSSMINSLINSYGINGATISFSGECANCQLVNGVVVQKVYMLIFLKQDLLVEVWGCKYVLSMFDTRLGIKCYCNSKYCRRGCE